MHARLLLTLSLCTALISLWPGTREVPPDGPPPVATFSIVGFDPATGDLGVAVQSKFFGVGAVVPWARADIGAVATQAFANTSYGPEGLALLDDGLDADAVLERLTTADPGRARRQLGLVDARGKAAAFTGEKCFDWAGHRVGEGYCCQGNILVGAGVVDAMAKAFEAAEGELAERLLAALRAGQKAGGDRRGRQSAALLVVRRGGGYAAGNDRSVDLHVEDHETPIAELARLLALRRASLPPSRVPERLAILLREPREAMQPRSTPRSAWEAFVRLGQGRGVYLGTRHTKSGAEVHTFVPGSHRVVIVRMIRGGDGSWVVSKASPRSGPR